MSSDGDECGVISVLKHYNDVMIILVDYIIVNDIIINDVIVDDVISEQ